VCLSNLTCSSPCLFQTVFEAPPRNSDGWKSEGQSDSQESPRYERPLAYSDRTRVFQGDGKQGQDAASMLRVTGDSEHAGRADPNDTSYQGMVVEHLNTSGSPQKADLQYFATGNVGPIDVSHPGDDTLTQFDMDVSAAYGAPVPGQGVNAMDVVEVASPPIVLLTNEEDAIEMGFQRQNITGRIDKENVPCPRLCAASFSPGIGGIVCFNNGEVRKMWSWYEQSDPRRRAQLSAGKGPSKSTQRSNATDSNARDSGADESDPSIFNSRPQELLSSRRQECPRTLQDLEDMTDHARFSQWRSDESSGGESSMDDESDESLGYASGDDRDVDARKRVYEKYFGASEEKNHSPSSSRGDKGLDESPLSPPRSPSRQKQAPTSSKSNESAVDGSVGPSSDLVPAVFITHDQDDIVFSGQNEELARGWKLGVWCTVDDETEVETLSPRSLVERESADSNSRDFGWGWGDEGAALPRPHSGKKAAAVHLF